MKRIRQWGREIRTYFATHIMMRVICAMLAVLLLVMLLFQSYLQNQYYQYLLRQTRQTEQTVLLASSNVMNNTLANSLRIAGEMAADNELYKTLRKVEERGMLDEAYMQRELDNKLDTICHYSEHIAAIAVVSGGDLVYEFGRYWNKSDTQPLWTEENREILKQMYQGVMDQMSNQKTGYFYVGTEPRLRESDPRMRLFHIAVPLIGRNNPLEKVKEVLVISMNLEDMVVGSSLMSHNSEVAVDEYITDASDTLVFHEDETRIGQPKSSFIRRGGIIELRQKLDYFDWTLNISIDNMALRREVVDLFSQGMMVYLGLTVCLFLIWQISLRGILHPISRVKNAMVEIQHGRQQKIQIGGSHEIWQVAQQYNQMVDALEEQRELTENAHREKMLSMELRQEAQIKALESQIDAHFLCNTLNAIHYNVIESGHDEVAVLLKQLSSILQYTFASNTDTVTLGQEIHWLEQYLHLQKYRLMDKFDYEIHFPEEYSEWPCCKLILQPFAENAIVHGFEGIDAGGRIDIDGRESGGRFVIRIRDNGNGMPPETAEAIQTYFRTKHDLKLHSRGSGIGIGNVVTRMKLFFGENFDVQMETRLGEGTCFTFWLPLQTGVEDEDGKDEDIDC